jgi:4,4'-diaponeurosporenoate glycosyltransferase
VVVFLDADVRLGAGALDRLVAEAAAGGLVSVQPWHDTERPYEQLSALFNVIAVMGTGAGGSRPTGAFGPVLATTASAYRRVGGHEAVRDDVVEDVALADRYRAAAESVRIAAGRGSFRFRMYPAGVRQLVEGWTKNFATGAGATRPVRLAAIVAWIIAAGSAVGLLSDAAVGALPWWVALAVYGGFVAQFLAMFRQVGRFGVPAAVLYPALVLFFLGVFARSAWRTYVRRSVEWRGRIIPVGAARG